MRPIWYGTAWMDGSLGVKGEIVGVRLDIEGEDGLVFSILS